MKIALYISLIIAGFSSAIVFSIAKGILWLEAYSGAVIFLGCSALAILSLTFSFAFSIALLAKKIQRN
jgi:hypothetical protein